MEVEFLPLTEEALNYLIETRKLSEASISAYKLGCNKRGEILIPFFDENEDLKAVKNRSATGGLLNRVRYDQDDEGNTEVKYQVKTDSVKGSKPVLLGSHLWGDHTTLIICYGDYDALTLYECDVSGVHGAAASSMPFGDRGTNWIEKQWDRLQKFDKVIFCPDYDDNEKTQAHLMSKLQEMAKRLGKYKCYMVQEQSMFGLKDINELYIHHGRIAIIKAINAAIPVPEPGLVKLSEYVEPEFIEGTPSGYEDVDKASGGHAGGLLTIISGDNNAGKTTFLLNLIAQFLSEREKSFFWSGEQKPDRMRWWLEQIIAGPDNLESRVSPKTQREYWFADPRLVTTIRDWYRDLLFVYDKRGIEAEQFFEVAELAVRRYGVTKIFIDNLMAFTGGEDDYYAAQGNFAESCKNFAEDWDVHVFLITHNKKLYTPTKVDDKESNKGYIPNKDDVEGSKKVTNWADFVFQLLRITEANRTDKWGNANAILSLCKNRETESLVDVRLLFDAKSKRLVQMKTPENTKRLLGWEPKVEQTLNF